MPRLNTHLDVLWASNDSYSYLVLRRFAAIRLLILIRRALRIALSGSPLQNGRTHTFGESSHSERPQNEIVDEKTLVGQRQD